MKKLLGIILILFTSVLLHGQTQIKYTSANLNLRISPSIEKNIITTIPKGTTIGVNYSNQEYYNWIKITYNGRTGYVYSKYLVSHKSSTDYTYTTSNSKKKYYTNSFGQKVQSPTYYSSSPKGATAVCRDGTYSFSRSRRGTCSHHGGVRKWL